VLAATRHKKILEQLQSNGFVKVSELSQQFDVTEKTIREDLMKLEKQQWLKRIHGGAVYVESSEQPDFALKLPNTVNPSEKELIASYVVSQIIQEHDIIALDSGSTTLEIARQLDNIPLTIITNDLLIMREVMMKEHIKLIVPGGYSKHNLLIPSHPLEWLQEINIYKLFLSTSGIHPNYGLSIFSNEQLAMKKALIQAAQEVICVADHSKFGRGALHTFATIEQIQQFVTDAGIAASDIELMQQAGAQVCVANA